MSNPGFTPCQQFYPDCFVYLHISFVYNLESCVAVVGGGNIYILPASFNRGYAYLGWCECACNYLLGKQIICYLVRGVKLIPHFSPTLALFCAFEKLAEKAGAVCLCAFL